MLYVRKILDPFFPYGSTVRESVSLYVGLRFMKTRMPDGLSMNHVYRNTMHPNSLGDKI